MVQNQPSEPELTIEEREEFFAGQDAITGMFNGVTGGIFVTSITPPVQGWPVATYCPLCKETTFVLSPWAAKPEKGDYWRMDGICGSDVFQDIHNIKMSFDKMHMEYLKYRISPKSIYGYDPMKP